MPRALSWLGRYGWVIYWSAFAVFTLNAARYPGFVPHPETAPYPWVGALVTCALLAAQCAALNATLRPVATTRSWRRVVTASGLALLFGVLSTTMFSSDMPGYYDAPVLFAVANVVLVPLVGAVLVLRPRAHDIE